MKKIYLFSVIAVAILAVIVLSSCNPLVNPGSGGGSEPSVLSTSIKAVRLNATTFLGTVVSVEGTVTCAPGEIAPWWAYIQSGDYGILIDGNESDSAFSSLKRGDKVKVTGVVDEPSAKYLEIGKYGDAAKVEKLGTASLPTPKVVSIDQLKTDSEIQGTLIKLENVSLEDTTQWPTQTGEEVNVVLKDASGATITMHIDKDTDIDGSPTPSGTFDVVGLAAYYNNPQILPRNLDDIITK